MQGLFTFTKHQAGKLTDADFQKAMQQDCLDKLLADLPISQQVKAVSNRLFDNMASYLFFRLFTGAPNPSNIYSQGGNAAAALASICLQTTDAETDSYTEDIQGFTSIHALPDTVNNQTAGKRFVEDGIRAFEIQTDPGALGRQAISFTNRWLYTPSQGISQDIRSIGIIAASDADHTVGASVGRIGRVRLKDDAGRNIILHKGDDEVLMVQYTCTLVSN